MTKSTQCRLKKWLQMLQSWVLKCPFKGTDNFCGTLSVKHRGGSITVLLGQTEWADPRMKIRIQKNHAISTGMSLVRLKFSLQKPTDPRYEFKQSEPPYKKEKDVNLETWDLNSVHMVWDELEKSMKTNQSKSAIHLKKLCKRWENFLKNIWFFNIISCNLPKMATLRSRSLKNINDMYFFFFF